MRIIIAGSRTTTEPHVRAALDACPWIGFVTAVVSGGARGADEFGEKWARERNLAVIRFEAEWNKYGKRAGPLRNKVMSENADGLVAIWDGASRGTASMIELGKDAGLRIFIARSDQLQVYEVPPTGRVGEWWELAEEKAAMMEFAGDASRQDAEKHAGREVSALIVSSANA